MKQCFCIKFLTLESKNYEASICNELLINKFLQHE